MAMNNSEKKKIKIDAKKIGRIICFVFLTLALLVGIIFSSVKVNMDMIYGPEYNGAFQASVQVVQDDDNDGEQLSNEEIAKSLTDKLSPFGDNSVTVAIKGKEHFTVTAGKQYYQDNQTFLRNQIESNGGIFILNPANNYSDMSLSGDSRYASKDVFKGSTVASTLSNGTGRDPFVQFKLDDLETLQKIIDPGTKWDNTKPIPQAMFVSDLEELVDTLRYFYTVNDSENTLKTYLEQIIKPAQDQYAKANETEKNVWRDLFSGTVTWNKNDSTIKQTTKISLLDTTENGKSLWNNGDGIQIQGKTNKTITGIDNIDSLEAIIPNFTPNTTMSPTSEFIYSANADKASDLTDDKNQVKGFFQNYTASKVALFNATIKLFLGESPSADSKTPYYKGILFDNNSDFKSGDITPKINSSLLKIAPQLQWNVIFDGGVIPSTKKAGSSGSISGEVATKNSFLVDDPSAFTDSNNKAQKGFYLRTKSMTSAKKAVSSVIQNGYGISYLVESVSDVNPYITSVLYIVSLVFLSLIAILLAAYILYAYRLLGLFTIIIAACSVAIVLLAATGFSIAMGPQVICALFVIIAMILDTSLILFEKWKQNYYDEKHGIVSSFKIGNRATLAMTIDAVITALIPSLVLFWATTGNLKTFGILTIIGAALVVVVGIIIGRFIYWLILKNKWVQKTDWLLPIDTRYSSLATIKNELAINKYSNYLDNHSGQTAYSTSELESINNAKEQLEKQKKAYNARLLENNKKVVARDQKTIAAINKNTQFLNKLRAVFISKFRIKHPEKNWIIKLIDSKLDDNKFIVNADNKTNVNDASNTSALKDKGKAVRADRAVGRGTTYLSIVLFALLILSAIIGGALGVSWTSGVGYGQQFVVYGDQIKAIKDKITFTDHNGTETNDADREWKLLGEKYKPEDNAKDSDKNLNYAYQISDFLQYLNDNSEWNQVVLMDAHPKDIKLGKTNFKVVINFQHVGIKDGKEIKSDSDMVAIIIDSSSRDKLSRTNMKQLLINLTGKPWNQGIWESPANKDSFNTPTGGILGYDLSPFTISNDIRNLGIAFGIALAVLVAYILIRFKWTYYVALALGLALVVGTVVALIVIFQVPMSTELLCGMAFVIIFALTSMILVLGAGKSKLNLDSKENIKENFSDSIQVSSEIWKKRADTKAQYVPTKEKMNKIKNQIFKLKMKKFFKGSEFNQDKELHDLQVQYGELKNDYKATKKEQVAIYKQFKKEGKQKADKLMRNNWYFKELFASLIKYSGWRMATLGVFYLLTGIILTVTLPTIFGMGLTIIFGIIAGFAIALFVSVPIWVYFEKRRIRYVYGRKQYIESLKVSHEEEIVKGIND